jgi:hypothetical protein
MVSTPPSIERLYVTDPKPVEPVELAPALRSLASLHAAALRFGYPLDQASNLASVCRLLAVPGGLEVAVDDGLSTEDASLVVRTGREAHAYACAVLARIPTVACALGESALEALVESSVLAAHAPSLHAKLVRELGIIRVASSECERAYQIEGRLGGKLYGFDLLDALAEADDLGSRLSVRGGRVLPLADRQVIEHNRERTRDAFYSLLRASASRSVGLGQDASIANRARAVIANTHPANMRWLADLFVARLSQSSAVGETDEELGKSITPARLSRLHERIVGGNAGVPPPHGGGRGGGGRGPGGRGRGRGGGGGGRGGPNGSMPSTSFGGSGDHSNGSAWPSFIGLFPSAQQPYVRFIEATDSHKFCVALQRSLVAALHALDPNSKASCLEQDGEKDHSLSSSRHAGQTERMLAARAIGSFLGLLTFGFATSGSMGSPSSSEHSPSQGIDLTATLKRATRRGELVVSAPWVLAFLRFVMWDAESLESAHYADALAYLRAISSSPNLSAVAVGGEFNASRTCLRSILAVGLSATAPVTAAQASSWYADAPALVSTLPPPPVAATDAFPTTSRESIERIRDPLATSAWGVDWVPAVSANASVAANTASVVPDSPNGGGDDGEASDARAETEIAPDLSRVGVDKRYVEYACPSLDAAVKTLRRRSTIAKSFAEGSASASASASAALAIPLRGDSAGEITPGGGVPRRMQAQPQRVEPTRTTPRTNFGSSGGGASPTFGVTSPTVAQPTSGGGSTGGGSLLTSASPSPSVKHALQRAFLQNLPGLRRLVDFAVDAATLACGGRCDGSRDG